MTPIHDGAPGKLGEGLCSDCTHARRIESDRGSIFILCQFSSVDPTFPKYPRLPVLSCSAYSPGKLSTPTAEPRSPTYTDISMNGNLRPALRLILYRRGRRACRSLLALFGITSLCLSV